MTVPFMARTLSLEYPLDKVPKDGQEVLSSPSAPVKYENKEPAGWLFHEAALLKAGVKQIKRAWPGP